MLDDYKDEYANIQVPLHLKQKTLFAMKDEKHKQKSKYTKKLVIGISSFAAVAIIILFFVPKPSTETTLIAGKVIEKVTLEEGELLFEKTTDNSYHFGIAGNITIKTISKEQAKQSSRQIVEPLHIENYTLEMKQYFLKTEKNNKLVEWSYRYKNQDANLNVQIQNIVGKFSMNSTICGKDMAIYYDDEVNAIYEAYFVHEKKTYHIVMDNVTQAQFIEVLTNIAKIL